MEDLFFRRGGTFPPPSYSREELKVFWHQLLLTLTLITVSRGQGPGQTIPQTQSCLPFRRHSRTADDGEIGVRNRSGILRVVFPQWFLTLSPSTHMRAAYMIVDEMHEEHPELLKDQYWDEVVPKDLPYTVASEIYRRSEPKGSAEMFLQIKPADSMYANLAPSRKSTVDDMYADYESVDTPLVERRKNWFQRQLTRMGSSRSSITTYSTGPFGPRGRHNSVYSSPDVPIPQHPPHPHLLHKASLYDRLVGRKSIRGQVRRQGCLLGNESHQSHEKVNNCKKGHESP
ncbi:unnamed protein product [Timema podura]|uniref:Pheromone biosynthesis activating neuropeptide n=1 Tax=Timema podura TaxID=61482 RepID=A0ABN7P9H9_TIMPD|nr:unnamed protein product [Timema podura]